jgi:hypothetical protein
MKRKAQVERRVAMWCGVVGVLGGASVVAWAASGANLIFNGQVASTDVRTLNGKAYVPLSDIAKALDMVAVPVAGGYEIRKAGGATPIKGLRGKIGDVLFDGKWRFQVLSAQPVELYRMKHEATADYAIYNPVAEVEDNVFRAKTGRTLIAVKCRVTNGRNKGTHALWVSNTDTRTALADTEGESHPPIAYDLDVSEPFHSKQLVPGAKTDFTVLFSVPEGTKLKDLVFTLRTIDNNDKGNDARVSLGMS